MKDMTNHDIFHLLLQKNRSIKKRMDTGLRNHQLSMAQWSILFVLQKYGSMTQTEIWTYFEVEAPTITRTLERMEKNGWIERSQGTDRRERIIVLTKEAREIFNNVLKQVAGIEDTLLQDFTDAEKQQFYYLLYKINS